MIGVVTHFSYNDSAYKYLTPSNPAPNGLSVLTSLQTLGVRHLRDGDAQMGTNAAMCLAFRQASAMHIDDDIIIAPGDGAATFTAISTCVGQGLLALEGPNELDLNNDRNFASDDVRAMATLAAARGSAFPANVKLFAPSMGSACTSYPAEAAVQADAVAALFDYNNAHIYFSGYQPENTGFGTGQCGFGGAGSELSDVSLAKIPAPMRPLVVTESGYPDDCCSLSDAGYVPPDVKTKYTLRTLLGHYMSGARYAYVYELATEGQSYGLTDQYLNPKPAYTALENFISILKDPGASAAAGTLRFSLGGSLTTVDHLLLTKQDGSFWLVLWQPAQSWNPFAQAPIAVPPVSGTINFATPPATLRLYTFNPADGSVTSAALVANSVVNISVSDTPEILQIGSTTSNPMLAVRRAHVH